jgi:lipopolysaccharide export LptBFGC system permease protein LptF
VIVLIKLLYAGAIAALLVLLVAFGIRAVYAPPEAPAYPSFPRAYVPPAPTIGGQTPAPLTPEQEQVIEAQERYQTEYERYQDRRADYHRNVFLAAAVLAVLAVAGGLVLPSYLDAIRLGLVGGGFTCVIYGVVQAGNDLDSNGPGFIVLVAGVGLALILAAGFRWLAQREEPAQA